MFDRFREKREKKKNEKKTKSRKSNSVLITLVVSFLIGFFFALGTNNFLIIIPIVFLPLAASFLVDSLNKDKSYEEKDKENLIFFYEYFLHYSALEKSYRQGLEKAIDLIPISHFREEAEREKERDEFTFETFSCSRSFREERVFQYFYKLTKSEEEVDRYSLEKFSSLLEELKKERESEVSSFDLPLPLILLALFALLLVTCLLSSV